MMPKPKTFLGQNAERLLSAVRALGPGWHGRTEIAHSIGQRRLTNHEAAALEHLVEIGDLDAFRQEMPASSPIRERWMYKLVEKK